MKVLLPIDGSDAANEAVEFVRDLANGNSVDVTVLVASYNPAEYSFQPWMPEWTEQEKARTREILMKAKQTLTESCQSVSTVQRSGSGGPQHLGSGQGRRKRSDSARREGAFSDSSCVIGKRF